MKILDNADFFAVNHWMLNFAGLWKPDTKNKYLQNCYFFYAVLVYLFVNLWFTLTEFMALFYTYKNQYALIKNVNFFLTHFMGAVKVTFWFYYGRYLVEIMDTLKDPQLLQYNSYMDYQPADIYQRYRKTGIKYSLLFLSMAHATLISSYIFPTITTIQYLQHFNKTNVTHQVTLPTKLPYYSWMPFSYDTGFKYLLALAYQAGPMFSYAYSIVGMDSLFMNIMNCVAGHLTIIQGAFETIRERCIDCRENENPILLLSMNNELRKIMKHLQIVLGASKQLENVHRFVTLMQMTATLFILCTCLYLISIAPPFSEQFIVEIVYMVAMSFQLFIYCWFGNQVTLKFQELPTYIWNGNWFETDMYFKKCMIFTMLRARRPIYFTAGQFFPLTLPSFMSILKTSYSIFALIKNTDKN